MRNQFYRPDIDGLRALAVLPVVLYHGKIAAFSGGFVGVDVFFVVSGYLITQILMRHINEQEFSITLFYERRIRRIAPALFLVLSVAAAMACFLLLPKDLVNFAESTLATVFFSSNFFFWSDTGYFTAPAEFKPLLHTWSLAVEEQFYIFYPPLLLVVQRNWPGRLGVLLWLGILASLCLSVWGTIHTPGAAFYLPVTRAWELLLGAVVAVGAVPCVSSKAAREFQAAAGLGLILYALFTYTAGTPFPGVAALAPCLGAALFIHANSCGATWAGRLLSAKPIVAVGLISYSLYLWHWPLFVFAKYYLVRHLYPMEVAVVIGFSLVLSYLTWRWVEQPMRRVGSFSSRTRLFGAAGVAALVLVMLAAGLWVSDGLRGRFKPEELRLLAEAGRRPADRLNCLNPSSQQVLDGGLCVIGEQTEEPPAFVLWGDSHAEAIRAALELQSRESDVWGYFAFYVSCPPLLGVENRFKPTSHKCAEFNQAMAARAIELGVSDVVLVGMWAAYSQGVIQTVGSGHSSVGHSQAAFKEGLEQTLMFLRAAGVRTWIVSQVPRAKVDVGRALALRRRYGIPLTDIEPLYDDYIADQAYVGAAFHSAAQAEGVYLIDPAVKLCDGKRCRVLHHKNSLYSDDDHLSEYGARWIADLFKPFFQMVTKGGS